MNEIELTKRKEKQCNVCSRIHDAKKPSPAFYSYLRKQRETKLSLIAAIFILPGFIYQEILHNTSILIDIFSLFAIFLAGIPVFQSAWLSIWKYHRFNIHVLMSTAAIGSIIIGVYTEAGMVMILFSLSEAIEGYTIEKNRDSINNLLTIVPKQATLIKPNEQNDYESLVDLQQLKIGDTILVKPGEQIPMDGNVIHGYSNVNQAPITGESSLVEKSIGSNVYASSINGEGALLIKVTNLATDNTINRMISLIEENINKRIPAQRFIDRFANYYTPSIIFISILVAAVPPLFFNLPFFNLSPEVQGWFYRGLSLLVVGCPCALVISTPVTIISAIRNASHQGVLIKGGIFLEKLSQINTIAFDKTGTLTEGKPSVIKIRSISCINHSTHDDKSYVNICKEDRYEKTNYLCDSCSDLIALASAIEKQSEHPVASAITSEASFHNVENRYPSAENVKAIIGRGITGKIQNQEITIASHTYFDNIPHPIDHCKAADHDSANGFTPIMIESDGKYLGTVTIADKTRQSSLTAINQLKKIGIKNLIMLTGDKYKTAKEIGEKVGITEIFSDLLPEDKVKKIKDLQNKYGSIAMVGDGINDAPALACADVGIAIGGSNTSNQAMETADITLLSGDLQQLPHIVLLSKKTMQTLIINIAVILLIKLGFIGLISFGFGTMWMAVMADTGLTLLVTLNSMRLMNFKY